MKEGTLTAAIMKHLNKVAGGYSIKMHGSVYSRAGMPDIIFIRQARSGAEAVFFELKVPGNEPTKIQLYMAEKLREHGALVAVVHSVEEVKAFLSLHPADL